MARLSKPKQTPDGWTIAVRAVNGTSAVLGPFPTVMHALEAQCDWHNERLWEQNLRTVHAIDQAEGALANSWINTEA